MILVLGSGGLLGAAVCRADPKDTIGYSHHDFKVTSRTQARTDVGKLLDTIMPDALINCIGVVDRNAPYETLKLVNTDFPYAVAEQCSSRGVRMIQVSTDCVFSGAKGRYHEDTKPDAVDNYGLTKMQGEVCWDIHLTVRTSFVGLPDLPGRGLLAWLKRNAGQEVQGWANARWNGLTVDRLAVVLLDLAYRPRIWGIRHVFGDSVSKLSLLRMANELWQFGCSIVPVEQPVIDHTLDTIYDDGLDRHPPLFVQLESMYDRWNNDICQRQSI